MFPFRSIIAVVSLVLFFAATTGVPVMTHYCGGEAVAETCPPDECCQDEAGSDTQEEESCCTEEVSVTSVDNEGQTSHVGAPVPSVSEGAAPSLLDNLVQRGYARLDVGHVVPCPAQPPDQSTLCLYRI